MRRNTHNSIKYLILDSGIHDLHKKTAHAVLLFFDFKAFFEFTKFKKYNVFITSYNK